MVNSNHKKLRNNSSVPWKDQALNNQPAWMDLYPQLMHIDVILLDESERK